MFFGRHCDNVCVVFFEKVEDIINGIGYLINHIYFQ